MLGTKILILHQKAVKFGDDSYYVLGFHKHADILAGLPHAHQTDWLYNNPYHSLE